MDSLYFPSQVYFHVIYSSYHLTYLNTNFATSHFVNLKNKIYKNTFLYQTRSQIRRNSKQVFKMSIIPNLSSKKILWTMFMSIPRGMSSESCTNSGWYSGNCKGLGLSKGPCRSSWTVLWMACTSEIACYQNFCWRYYRILKQLDKYI